MTLFELRRRYRYALLAISFHTLPSRIYDVFMRARNELFAFSSIEVFDVRQSKLVPPLLRVPPLSRPLAASILRVRRAFHDTMAVLYDTGG